MTAAPLDRALPTALRIERSPSLPEIRAAIRDFASPLGYDRFVLFSASARQGGVVDRIYWVEGDWFGDEGFDAETYIRQCPVTRHVLETRAPFFWTKRRQDGTETYRVTRQPRGSGLHGIQIPVYGPLGLEGAASLGGARIDASDGARLALQVVATAGFTAARRLLDGPPRATELSAREREVLGWTALGRRQTDIAAGLGLSARTVENHLRRIRQKLGVATTAQAVGLALLSGQIDG